LSIFPINMLDYEETQTNSDLYKYWKTFFGINYFKDEVMSI